MEVRENIMGYLVEGCTRQENSRCKVSVTGLWLACLGSSEEARAEEPLAGTRLTEGDTQSSSDRNIC